MSEGTYQGTELDLFAHASHWKRYWSAHVAPLLRGRVLDVGAGIGATIESLNGQAKADWTALEPDPDLAQRIHGLIAAGKIPGNTKIIVGNIATLSPSERFDCILYIDVLEHIKDDADELRRASQHLLPGGHLIVLAPAHQWLFTAFDHAIGHHRRYNRGMLAAISPACMTIEKIRYLDSVGLLASLANRLLLKSAQPTRAQISFWDRVLVPASTVVDRISFGHLGKSVLMIARRN